MLSPVSVYFAAARCRPLVRLSPGDTSSFETRLFDTFSFFIGAGRFLAVGDGGDFGDFGALFWIFVLGLRGFGFRAAWISFDLS